MRSNALRHPARLAGASLLRLQSDERLLELAVDGHEPAFTAIVDRYRAPLLRYCTGLVGAARAEDAVQQTLINAHAALTRTSDVIHLRSWIYRIAHNASLNLLRSVRDDMPLDAAHPAMAGEPHDAFEQTERLRATLDAVRDLPERQRAALVLRELEGRSHEEIAAALGVTPGSARQHLMRARAAVRAGATAVTPYPLLVKLASAMVSGGAWGEAAATAGLGATVTKLTAGVLATGALVGGAVGTGSVVGHRHHHGASDARARDAATTVMHRAPAPRSRDVSLATATPLPRAVHHSSASRSGSGSAGHSDRSGHGGGSGGTDHSGSSGSDGSGRGDGSGSGSDNSTHHSGSQGSGSDGGGSSPSDGSGTSGGKTPDGGGAQLGDNSGGPGGQDATPTDGGTDGSGPSATTTVTSGGDATSTPGSGTDGSSDGGSRDPGTRTRSSDGGSTMPDDGPLPAP